MKTLSIAFAFLLSFAATAEDFFPLNGVQISTTEKISDFKVAGDMIETPTQIYIAVPKLTYLSSTRGKVSTELRLSNTHFLEAAKFVCEAIGAKSYYGSKELPSVSSALAFVGTVLVDAATNNRSLVFRLLEEKNSQEVYDLVCNK